MANGSRGSGAFDGVTITVGTESANVINVALQFTLGGADVAEEVAAYCWLTDVADPGGAQTAHATSPAIGTDGALHVLTTDLNFMVISEADGDADIDLTDTGAETTYLHVRLPDGSIVTSDVITHAA